MGYLKNRWNAEGGYKEVLNIALPLIFSTGAFAIQHFVDRMFLTWYSSDAIAAAMPAGILTFTIASFFIGTASYVSTFTAQYYGAKICKKIGPIIWQGVYVSVIGYFIHLSFTPFADNIFNFIGHEPGVIENEIIYFRVLCYGAFRWIPPLLRWLEISTG